MVGGIGDGDENPDDVPRSARLAVQARFSYHDPFIDVCPIGWAFLVMVIIEIYDKPAEGMLATARPDRL